MQRKPKIPQKQQTQVEIDLQPEIRQLLSFQYLTKFPQKVTTFSQLLQLATSGIQQSIFRLKTGLTSVHIDHYGIKNHTSEQCPYPEQQQKLLQDIIHLCETIIHKNDYCTTTETLKQLNLLLHEQCHHSSLRDDDLQEVEKIDDIQQPKLKIRQEQLFHQKEVRVYQEEERLVGYEKSRMRVHLKPMFNQFGLNFKYVNVKEAMVFQALRRCQIWFTICRERKKSLKGFYLDPLINTFDSIIKKLGINSPFHISVLPRKNVKKMEQKKNVEKAKNALFEAVSSKNYAEVKKLILNGADIQAPAFGNDRMARQMRCAHKAAQNNDLQMCKILTSFGVNWQSLDSQNMTPLYYTIHRKSTDVLHYLIQEIHVNIEHQQIQNRSPFYWACTEGQLQYIKYLYQRGANVNSKSKLGRCPLSKACFLGRRDIVEFLLQCKEIDLLSKDQKGRTALHNATFGPKGGREGVKFGTNQSDSPDCAQLLLEKGFPVDEVDFERNTALHIAASSQALNSIPLLISFGANIAALNDYGQTPILTGAKFGHIETVRMLYEKYNSSILEKDIFSKNIILLVAKFRQFKQNTARHFPAEGTIAEKTAFRKQNTDVNPVFEYIVDKFVYEAYTKYVLKDENKGLDEERQANLKELHATFFQLMKHGVHEQFMLFMEKMIENKVPFVELQLKDVKTLLQMELSFEAEREKNVVLSILKSKNAQGYHVFQLFKDDIKEFVTWLIRKNSNTLMQFIAANDVLVFYHFSQKKQEEHQTHYSLPMSILAGSIPFLKQKIITFCLFRLNFNWIDFVDETTGGNILHLLVKSRKVGSLIQITKLLGGKKLDFIRNKYVTRLLKREQEAEDHHQQNFTFSLSPVNQLFMLLLSHKDNDGLTPYQLAHIVKENSIIKILSQRMKQRSLQWGNGLLQNLQVKEYKIERELEDVEQLKRFQVGHEKEQQLQKFITLIQACTTREELAKHMRLVSPNPKELSHKVNIDTDVLQQWHNFPKRPLHFIKTQQDIAMLLPLLQSPVVGIDVQYDFADGNQTIICIIQLSSIQQDYIVDMMSCAFENGQNRYVQFISKMREEFFQKLCYDERITKCLHGSDHDLYILKSCFNCSFVNFLDSSRVDIELRRIKEGRKGNGQLVEVEGESPVKMTMKKDKHHHHNSLKSAQLVQTKSLINNHTSRPLWGVRGLATLVKQYLDIPMSKDHQISEWRIRPIPATMIDYARRDSMIMPFLVYKQLSLFDNIEDLKQTIVNGFRIAKKNKKVNQPLIKKLMVV